MTAKNEIIVARYKENIDWLESLEHLYVPIIYDKYHANGSNFLANVGRESQTYLYHIVNNYSKLSEVTVFCQGNPIDHEPNFISKLSNPTIIDNVKILGFLGLGPQIKEGPYANFDPRHPNGLPMFYILDLLFGLTISNNTYDTMYGAQFIVTKSNIQNRPPQLYNFLLQFVLDESNPIEGYIFERLWPYIFNPKFELSPKISRILKFF